MNTEKLTLIPYNNLEVFIQELAVITPPNSAILIRINGLERRSTEFLGSRRTPYVVVQLRLHDEIHIVKFIGSGYDYWGSEFENHVAAHYLSVEWTVGVETYLEDCFSKLGCRVVRPSYYYHPDLHKVAGITGFTLIEEGTSI